MTTPVWIVVFDRGGCQQSIVRCVDETQVRNTTYHNQYYGRRCLVIRVKEIR